VDTHIKHAISKPRVATTIRRMTAMFNFSSELRKLRFFLALSALDAQYTYLSFSRPQRPFSLLPKGRLSSRESVLNLPECRH
jgi:hypothetical protein